MLHKSPTVLEVYPTELQHFNECISDLSKLNLLHTSDDLQKLEDELFDIDISTFSFITIDSIKQ